MLGVHATALILILSATFFFSLLLENYYHIPKDLTSAYVGSITFTSCLCSAILSQFVGLLYDILGRRVMVVGATLIGGITLVVMPLSSNVFPELLICRVVVANCGVILMGNPLLMDYVTQENKGLAAGFLSLTIGVM